jgi:hypothetical protein
MKQKILLVGWPRCLCQPSVEVRSPKSARTNEFLMVDSFGSGYTLF